MASNTYTSPLRRPANTRAVTPLRPDPPVPATRPQRPSARAEPCAYSAGYARTIVVSVERGTIPAQRRAAPPSRIGSATAGRALDLLGGPDPARQSVLQASR